MPTPGQQRPKRQAAITAERSFKSSNCFRGPEFEEDSESDLDYVDSDRRDVDDPTSDEDEQDESSSESEEEEPQRAAKRHRPGTPAPKNI